MYATLSTNEVLQTFSTSIEGLSHDDVAQRREQYGLNALEHKKRSMLWLFLLQFHDVMVYILIGALAISIASPFFEGGDIHLEHFVDAIVIAVILLLNAVLGFVQEYKAEEAIEMLRNLTSPTVRVRRSGREEVIMSQDLVPGDIVIIESGDKISADGRLIKASHLQVNESSLTGESQSVEKDVDPIKESTSTLAHQKSMVFSGTMVSAGTAEFIVTAIGLQTEIGKIAKLVSETAFPETPLQRRMQGLGKLLGSFVLAISVLVFVIGYSKQMPFTEILLVSVSLAVSAVPEGLPAVVTICMAMGVRRMAKKNALVRRLESLETLGSITVICADKTGTITQNAMTVQKVWLNSTLYTKSDIALIAASCNTAQLPDIGDPTEIGLLKYAKEQNIQRLRIDEEELPFSSENKYMQTRHGDRVFLKGAPEVIFDMAVDETEEILQTNELLASQGLRILACAEKVNNKVHFVGLIAMEDPPRATAKQSIEEARHAGIRTIMITGDNIQTAQAIAKQVGIEGDAMHGDELNDVSKEDLIARLSTVSVFARVSPEHKLKILEALQSKGEVVAMSGDGVNDAPALKGAHVGVAMGKVGTDVARESAGIVLADDHYGTIVLAIKEGRRIYDNIRKFVFFLLRANFDELLLIIVTLLMGIPIPYLPVHILWINLMTDSLPALALGMEPAEKGIMQRPPRNPNEHLLHGQSGKLFFAAVYGFGASLALYLWQLLQQVPLEEARTVALTYAILFELLLVHSTRSEKPLWNIGLFSNIWMIWGTAIPFVLQLVLLYSPIGAYFYLTPMTIVEWFEVFTLAFLSVGIFELLKLLPENHSEIKKKGA